MSNNTLALDILADFWPHCIKTRLIDRIRRADTVYVRIVIAVIVVRRLNQFAYSINNTTTFNPDDTDLTNAPTRTLCGFEVYGGEITHNTVLHIEVFFLFMSRVLRDPLVKVCSFLINTASITLDHFSKLQKVLLYIFKGLEVSINNLGHLLKKSG